MKTWFAAWPSSASTVTPPVYKLRKKVITEPGFTDWKFMTFDYDLPKSDDSPIWIEPRALRVTLPKALKPEEFETRLREALKPISLTIWAQSDEGRHHFNALGHRPGHRGTLYTLRLWREYPPVARR